MYFLRSRPPGSDDRDTDLFLCDTNTCKFDAECLRIGEMVTCICDLKVRPRRPLSHFWHLALMSDCFECNTVSQLAHTSLMSLNRNCRSIKLWLLLHVAIMHEGCCESNFLLCSGGFSSVFNDLFYVHLNVCQSKMSSLHPTSF